MNHIFIIIVRQICISQFVQHKWHFHLLWTFSSKNTSLFIFTHFWWKHSSQTEQHAINKPSSFFLCFGSLSSKFQRHMQNTCTYVMYDLHLFERFAIFGNGSNLFCAKNSFRWGHIRFVGCSFWFYIKNTICCECDCKYSIINVVGLMLA